MTVTGQSPLVDDADQPDRRQHRQEELAALPILNKNWMMAVGLTPGVQVASRRPRRSRATR